MRAALKKLVIALGLVLAVFGAPACGGNATGEGGGDEARIRALIDLGNSKNAAVCDRMTDRAMANLIGGDRATCAQRVNQSPADSIQVQAISVNGDTATVTAELAGEPAQVTLVKQGGEWKFDYVQRRY